jgi:hypothetical protein
MLPKKLLAILPTVFALFLAAPVMAYAADFTFTASDVTYNPSTHKVLFTASDFSSPVTDGFYAIGVASPSCHIRSCESDTTWRWSGLPDNPEAYSDPKTFTTLGYDDHGFYDPQPGDQVYLFIVSALDNHGWSTNTFTIPSSATPTPTPAVQIVADPSSATETVGTPFKVEVKVNDGGQAFNAAQATVTLSSNLSILGLNYPSSNSCNFNYTKRPTTSDPSFAGAIFGGSSTGCTIYTLTLTPTDTNPGSITFSNPSIKAYTDGSEILTGTQPGSYTINAATPSPTPPGTTLVTVDDSVQGTAQNQWDYVGGGWSHCTDSTSCNSSSLYNNSTSWDNTTDDYATISFTGIQASLYGLVDPNHGIAAVSIDGGAETNVDFYSATRTGNVLLWTSPLLTQGTHTLKVRVTGTKNSSSGGTYVATDRGDLLQTSPFSITVTNTLLDTYGPTFTLTGTKDSSISSVVVNGSSSNSTYPTSTSWQAVEPVVLGNNPFTLYGLDTNNDQTTTINVTVNMHALGDINGDGVVDLTDASLFAVDWGKTSNLTYPLSDMNGDGSVDLTDFSILAKAEQ